MANPIAEIEITGLLGANAGDTHAVYHPHFMKGSLRTVENTTERDAIPENRRDVGMLVYVSDDDEYYKLKNSPWNNDDSDWTIVISDSLINTGSDIALVASIAMAVSINSRNFLRFYGETEDVFPTNSIVKLYTTNSILSAVSSELDIKITNPSIINVQMGNVSIQYTDYDITNTDGSRLSTADIDTLSINTFEPIQTGETYQWYHFPINTSYNTDYTNDSIALKAKLLDNTDIWNKSTIRGQLHVDSLITKNLVGSIEHLYDTPEKGFYTSNKAEIEHEIIKTYSNEIVRNSRSETQAITVLDGNTIKIPTWDDINKKWIFVNDSGIAYGIISNTNDKEYASGYDFTNDTVNSGSTIIIIDYDPNGSHAISIENNIKSIYPAATVIRHSYFAINSLDITNVSMIVDGNNILFNNTGISYLANICVPNNILWVSPMGSNTFESIDDVYSRDILKRKGFRTGCCIIASTDAGGVNNNTMYGEGLDFIDLGSSANAQSWAAGVIAGKLMLIKDSATVTPTWEQTISACRQTSSFSNNYTITNGFGVIDVTTAINALNNPVVYNIEISDVTNLQTTLDDKVSKTGTNIISGTNTITGPLAISNTTTYVSGEIQTPILNIFSNSVDVVNGGSFSINGVAVNGIAGSVLDDSSKLLTSKTIFDALANYETTTDLDLRDSANRSRANHTGTQSATTISDFAAFVSFYEKPGYSLGGAAPDAGTSNLQSNTEYYVDGTPTTLELPVASGTGGRILLYVRSGGEGKVLELSNSGNSLNGVVDGTYTFSDEHEIVMCINSHVSGWTVKRLDVEFVGFKRGGIATANLDLDTTHIADGTVTTVYLPTTTQIGNRVQVITTSSTTVRVYPPSGGTLNGVVDGDLNLSVSDKVVIFYKTAAGNVWISKEVGEVNDTGWAQYKDDQYDSGSTLSILQGVTTVLTNNAASTITSYLPTGVTSFWDDTTNKLMPENIGDSYIVRVDFKAYTSTNNGYAVLHLDIGGAQGIILSRGFDFPRGTGSGNVRDFSMSTSLYTLGTFIANGGEFSVESVAGNTNIYDINIVITRVHKAK